MGVARLFIFVEGADDKRFFERIVKPEIVKKFSPVQIIEYSHMPQKKVSQFLRSIEMMKAVYLLVSDNDHSPCIFERKEKLLKRFRKLDLNQTQVVVEEIESWYLAGLKNSNLKKYQIKSFRNTDNLTKEQFQKLRPKRFRTNLEFMLELLNQFSIETAIKKNRSFDYFVEKYLRTNN